MYLLHANFLKKKKMSSLNSKSTASNRQLACRNKKSIAFFSGYLFKFQKKSEQIGL